MEILKKVAGTPMRFHSAVKRAIISGIILLLMPAMASAQSGSRYIKQLQGNQSVIVFVHGIFGDSISTWTNPNGAYFPALLVSDPFFSAYDVYVYEYPSRFLGTGFSIDEIAENMRLTLDTDLASDHKEIIFVSHSMGGLVTRAYLNKNRAAADRVRLAYFYSTPTTGSELASIASLVSRNPHLAKMKPMESADYLADLQRQWLDINFQIPSFCAYEKQSTYGINVVTQASASNLCNRRLDPIDADHITIVKPADTRDTPYLALKSAIQQTPPKVSANSATGVIHPVEAFLSHARAVEAQGYIGDQDTQTHTVFMRVNFRFLENRVNNVAYFRSFDDVSVKWISKSGGSGNSASAWFVLSPTETSPETFTAIVALKFSRRPEAGDRLIGRLRRGEAERSCAYLSGLSPTNMW